jgi:arylsulfatase A-like enzyme
MGKIYHHGSDYSRGWNKVVKITGEWKGRGYLSEEGMRIAVEYDKKNPKAKRRGMGPACEGPDVPDNAYGDGKILEAAIAELRRLKDSPFFLAVGFKKPHLPFNAPKKYWDLYDPAQIKLASNPYAPKGTPKYAATSWGELRGYHGMPRKGLMPDADARRLIHAYRACVSYVDAQIGRLLDELDSLGLADNTMIVLWGDHGWKLGEHGMWCKHTNFELDTHVPLIFVAPGVATRGAHSPALAEFVDIYPTLCELAGLKQPSHLEGTSLVPVLKEPTRSWKKAAISQYPRGNVMGYSLRTARFRYTEWQDRKDGKAVARELYDFERDPACNENLADKPEYAADLARLQELLRGGWKGCKP